MFKLLFVAAILALAAANPAPEAKAKPAFVAAYSAPVVAAPYAAYSAPVVSPYSAGLGYPYAYSPYSAPLVIG